MSTSFGEMVFSWRSEAITFAVEPRGDGTNPPAIATKRRRMAVHVRKALFETFILTWFRDCTCELDAMLVVGQIKVKRITKNIILRSSRDK